MSRIGKVPIVIPEGIKVTLEDRRVTVEGPKGSLGHELPEGMSLEIDDSHVLVKRATDSKRGKSLHGLTRTLLANSVTGVTEGFKKTLQIVGTGYRAEMVGEVLSVEVQLSHKVVFSLPEGITVAVGSPKGTKPPTQDIIISGIDKQLVGDVAAKIRSVRPPEPYKGKGIRYAGEVVRHKAGKTVGA
ncbi:MAG: 50S ribosomal protein L6 [candidate division Zixibacteria bacterium DG_27]|nr:MAG: 50S ribosomal protein L6 [candidate division Zixibacteria bacterium DG_27]